MRGLSRIRGRWRGRDFDCRVWGGLFGNVSLCLFRLDVKFEKEKDQEKRKRKKKTVCINMYLYLPITATLPATQRKKKVKLI